MPKDCNLYDISMFLNLTCDFNGFLFCVVQKYIVGSFYHRIVGIKLQLQLLHYLFQFMSEGAFIYVIFFGNQHVCIICK